MAVCTRTPLAMANVWVLPPMTATRGSTAATFSKSSDAEAAAATVGEALKGESRHNRFEIKHTVSQKL